MRNRHRAFLIGAYVLVFACMALYVLFVQNEYAWMQEMDPSITLPEDGDLRFKAFLLGVPTLAALGLLLYCAFMHARSIARILAILMSIAGVALVVARFPF